MQHRRRDMIDENKLSALVLEHTVFDCIEFHREGFQNDNDVQFNMQITTGCNENSDVYQVTLLLEGVKEEEYTLKIGLSGFFSINEGRLPENISKDMLIKNNAVAILMPYLRAEVSLLTSQPEMDCVIMPVFNVNALMEED
ncbi:MAG: protein-export chaperone SecB [Lachnospiraceae bacterium]|nr:protein-export chaperone SecB [Lachnospiraceae bacterium]